MSPLEAKQYGLIDQVIGGDDAGFKVGPHTPTVHLYTFAACPAACAPGRMTAVYHLPCMHIRLQLLLLLLLASAWCMQSLAACLSPVAALPTSLWSV